MSESERQTPQAAKVERREENTADEPFLARWSRLKADRASRPTDAAVPAPSTEAATEPAHEDVQGGSAPESLPPGDDDMPAIETLGEESDFSAFMSPRVSASLRKQALRKLFRSPKFNVISELDDYIEDYRNFPALGDIVTADMKHAAARLIEKQLKEAEAVAAVTGTEVATDGDPAPAASPDVATADDKKSSDSETSDFADTEESSRDA